MKYTSCISAFILCVLISFSPSANAQNTDSTHSPALEISITAAVLAQPGSPGTLSAGLLLKKKIKSDIYARAGVFTVPQNQFPDGAPSPLLNTLSTEGLSYPYDDTRIRYLNPSQYYQTNNRFSNLYFSLYTGLEKRKKLTSRIDQCFGVDLGYGQIRCMESTYETLVTDSSFSRPSGGNRPPLSSSGTGKLIYSTVSFSQVLTCSAFYGLMCRLRPHLFLNAQATLNNNAILTTGTSTDNTTAQVTKSPDLYHFNYLLSGMVGLGYGF